MAVNLFFLNVCAQFQKNEKEKINNDEVEE